MVNLEMSVRRELELEPQGFRRTRRWIGDAKEVSDPKWYQAKVSQISETMQSLNETNWAAETKPRIEPIRSTLNRFLNLPFSRRQPARSKA